jgi:hypothetical protein
MATQQCAPMGATIIDARAAFGNRRVATIVDRFEVELAAFERPCSDRARTFVDMFEAVSWARRHPFSAIYAVLNMDDDRPDPVYVSRLAKALYGDPRSRLRTGRNGRTASKTS